MDQNTKKYPWRALLAASCFILPSCGENNALRLRLQESKAVEEEQTNEAAKLQRQATEDNTQLQQLRSQLQKQEAGKAEFEAKRDKLMTRQSYLQAATEDVQRQTMALKDDEDAYRAKFLN